MCMKSTHTQMCCINHAAEIKSKQHVRQLFLTKYAKDYCSTVFDLVLCFEARYSFSEDPKNVTCVRKYVQIQYMYYMYQCTCISTHPYIDKYAYIYTHIFIYVYMFFPLHGSFCVAFPVRINLLQSLFCLQRTSCKARPVSVIFLQSTSRLLHWSCKALPV